MSRRGALLRERRRDQKEAELSKEHALETSLSAFTTGVRKGRNLNLEAPRGFTGWWVGKQSTSYIMIRKFNTHQQRRAGWMAWMLHDARGETGGDADVARRRSG